MMSDLVHKTEFLNLGFCSIFFQYSPNTIFQYFFFKIDLYSLRPFRLHSSEKDAEYQNNH